MMRNIQLPRPSTPAPSLAAIRSGELHRRGQAANWTSNGVEDKCMRAAIKHLSWSQPIRLVCPVNSRIIGSGIIDTAVKCACSEATAVHRSRGVVEGLAQPRHLETSQTPSPNFICTALYFSTSRRSNAALCPLHHPDTNTLALPSSAPLCCLLPPPRHAYAG